MRRTKGFIWAILSVSLAIISCDLGIGVAINNQTAQTRQIKVFYPEQYQFPGQAKYVAGSYDSVITYALPAKYPDSTRELVPRLYWDTIVRTYTFILKPYRSAIVESRSLAGFPTFGQVFIIDQKDTVRLEKKGKYFRKKPKLMLGGTWSYSINK